LCIPFCQSQASSSFEFIVLLNANFPEFSNHRISLTRIHPDFEIWTGIAVIKDSRAEEGFVTRFAELLVTFQTVQRWFCM
jgi:hypothetical protein